MDFNANKTLIEIIKEGAFGFNYFKDIYSDINKKVNTTIHGKNLFI